MRIVIIEDHLLLRDILRRACAVEFGHEVVAEADSGAAARAALAGAEPDLLVLDLQLPDCDGLNLLADIRIRRAGQKALVVSSRCDPYTVYRTDRTGVSGFIDKSSQTLAMIGTALRAIEDGHTYFCPTYADVRAARLRDPFSFDKILSERELEVLVRICQNLDDRDIGGHMGISPQTVEKHRFNILRKLGLPATPALIRYGRGQGFCGLGAGGP